VQSIFLLMASLVQLHKNLWLHVALPTQNCQHELVIPTIMQIVDIPESNTKWERAARIANMTFGLSSKALGMPLPLQCTEKFKST
jgi:hypothetical protein